MKTTIVLEYDKTEFNTKKIQTLIKSAIALEDDEIVSSLSVKTEDNAIVYQNADKILRVGDTVHLYNDTGYFGKILPSPSDLFEGCVYIQWDQRPADPAIEDGKILIKW